MFIAVAVAIGAEQITIKGTYCSALPKL